MKQASRILLAALLTMTGLVGCQCGLCKRPAPPPPPPPPGPAYIPSPPPAGAVAAPPPGAVIAPPPGAMFASPPPGAANAPPPRFPPSEVRNYPPGVQSAPVQTSPYDGGARGYLPEADPRQPARSSVQLQPPQVSESTSPPSTTPTGRSHRCQPAGGLARAAAMAPRHPKSSLGHPPVCDGPRAGCQRLAAPG